MNFRENFYEKLLKNFHTLLLSNVTALKLDAKGFDDLEIFSKFLYHRKNAENIAWLQVCGNRLSIISSLLTLLAPDINYSPHIFKKIEKFTFQ